MIREHLLLSQRVERFEILAERNGQAECLYRGTTIGHKRIVRLEDCVTQRLIIRITDSRERPAIGQLAVY